MAFLLAETIVSTLVIHPHYLAYFNFVSGGPSRGSEHLIDNNLDWGQDLVGLKKWAEAHAPGEPIGLAYFGQINPSIFLLRAHQGVRERPLDWYLPPSRSQGSMRGPTAQTSSAESAANWTVCGECISGQRPPLARL